MRPTVRALVQAHFQAALIPGICTAPRAVSQLLTEFSSDSQSDAFDAEAVGRGIYDEFPFLSKMLNGTSPDAVESIAWEEAIRWLLDALCNWDSHEENSHDKLCVLLGAITALDANRAGLSSVAAQVVSSQLTAALRSFIERADVASRFNEHRLPELRQQIECFTSSGNFEWLGNIIRHMNVFPSSNFWTAVIFMYNAEPAELAAIIERRNEVLFSIMICAVLETQAIEFAFRVNNPVFKFISVANVEQNFTSDPQQSLQYRLQTLLLQVAQTSAADWAAWMQVFFKYPGDNSSLNVALASVLRQLSQEHMAVFFKAISLSYSHRAAAPVANILSPLANSPNAEIKLFMGQTAYQVWSEWSYGEGESNSAMFAPVACALDFPVAMYFASMQSHDRLSEERNLLEAIETIEKQWFNSVTELVTERNRLKSCLRLVQHGSALANGSDQALPPPIQPDEDLYARTRYLYYE